MQRREVSQKIGVWGKGVWGDANGATKLQQQQYVLLPELEKNRRPQACGMPVFSMHTQSLPLMQGMSKR